MAGDSTRTSAHTSTAGRPEGRRERKKRETRQRISGIATGLMLERGFHRVTVAEIADAADVSVNTVYNYFATKEDLFFDRAEEMTGRPSRLVRERAPGESAADALLGRMRSDIAARNVHAGMMEEYDRFVRVVDETPALLARLYLMQQRTADRLARTLRAETGAEEGDPLPELVAGQLTTVSDTVFRTAAQALARGVDAEEVARASLGRLDAFETLASGALLRYATRAD